jgi:hypothetical protein
LTPQAAELLSIAPQLIYHLEYWMMMTTTTK